MTPHRDKLTTRVDQSSSNRGEDVSSRWQSIIVSNIARPLPESCFGEPHDERKCNAGTIDPQSTQLPGEAIAAPRSST
jgi:hypothetical protein